MMKKIIMTSVLGVSALALVNANADVTSPATPKTKPHHAKKHHHPAHAKKELQSAQKMESMPSNAEDMSVSVPAQTISSPVHHGLPAGLYVGAQVGYGQSPLERGLNAGNNGLAGRVNIGYQINKNFAVEAGYLSLHSVKENNADNNISYQSKQNVIDIAGKASYPLTQQVNVYGKAGVAYITSRYEDIKDKATIDLNDQYGVAHHKFAPEVAVGMDFNVTPNIAVDTSLTHIHPVGNKRPGNINYLAVGINYTFG